MPELDYAFMCDYARAEGGIAHAIAAGIDTIHVPATPIGANFGLLMRVAFTRNECDRPHRVEVIIQGVDGERLAQLSGVLTPTWREGLPVGWRTGAMMAFNLGVPIPEFGEYSISIMLGDTEAKHIDFRVLETAPPNEE